MKSISLTGVGNEIMTLNESPNIDIMENIPGMIDYSFQIPNFNFPNLKIYSGYLYFNLTVETFDVQVWRGSTLCNDPSRIMVFPSGYNMGGHTYWGTDFEPNYGTVKNSQIEILGSNDGDILASWGLYDAQFIHFLKDFALQWMKLIQDYGNDWGNHLLDNPKNYTVGEAIGGASHIMDAIGKYGVKGIYNIGKQKLGDAYDYVKKHPEIILKIGLSYAIEDTAGSILTGIGLSEGLAVVGAFLVASTFPIDKGIKRWNGWKKQHGGGGLSFAKFLTNYINPMDTNNLWKDWGKNCLDDIKSICDFLGGKPSSKSWADWYNKLSKEDYNSIVGDEVNNFSFMVRDCSYRTASYGGWMSSKYHIYSVYNFQKPKYDLVKATLLPGGDVFLEDLDFNIDSLFNHPFTDLIVLKNWNNDYPLLSQVLENNNINTLHICSSYPSYIQMKLFNIPRIKIG